MKKVLFLFLFLHLQISYGQGIDNLWMMGYDNPSQQPFGGVNINFVSNSPVITYDSRQINFSSTSVSICDSFGNLLFCSNGVYIANASGDTMLNGSGLSPGHYLDFNGWNGMFIPQASIIIPNPDNNSKYYLFHGSVDDENVPCALKFYYSEIDMTLDSGRGAVFSKNNILLNDTLVPGRITAVKHGNGRDWWIVIHQGKGMKYYLYLIDPSGIHQYDQTIGSYRDFRHGQACFSPDGNKFAYYDAVNDLDIMEFDRCTGLFSNPIHIVINDSAVSTGCAFSPNSRFLYVSSSFYVYQFDLQSTNILNSQTTVAVWDSFYSPSPPAATFFNTAQLAPNGKIYLSCANGTLDIHVINYPDSLGTLSDVCQHCIHLPAYNASTIPNLPNYFLGADGGSICDTLHIDVPLISSTNISYNLFPNPTRNILYITKNREERLNSLRVFNSIGQEQAVNYSSIKNGEYVEVNTSLLISGIYFLELFTEKQKVVKRFVKD